MKFKHILISIIIIFIATSSKAQCRGDVFGVPEWYATPVEDSKQLQKFKSSQCHYRNRYVPWVVYSDRLYNNVYKKPNESSEVIMQLDYKDWFFVIDEKKEWIKLAKGIIERRLHLTEGTLEEFGWIKKSNMLLWNRGIIDGETFITQKAFLLNKAENIECIVNKTCEYDLARIFKHPTKNDRESIDKTVYEFYFILKKEGNRYLLSKTPFLNRFPDEINENLIGWISKDKLTEWKTRIALEPNFGIGYEERKNDPIAKRFKAYGSIADAENAINGNANNPFWDYDPVIIKNQNHLNDKRFHGSVVRFPLLANEASNFHPDRRIISSGVIGEINLGDGGDAISEIEYAKFEEGFIKLREGVKKYDVVFLVEGGNETLHYKASLANTIPKLGRYFKQQNIDARFGVVIYRDFTETKLGVLNTFNLNPSANAAAQFIQKTKFNSLEANQNQAAIQYALTDGLASIGLDANMLSTKLIFLIGSKPDVSCNRNQLTLCNETPDCKKVIVPKKDVYHALEKYKAHLTIIQSKSNDTHNSCFERRGKKMLIELAKRVHSKYSQIEAYLDNVEIKEPHLQASINGWYLTNSETFGKYIILENERTSFPQLEKEIINAVKNINQHIQEFILGMDQVFKKGKSANDLKYASGGFTKHFLLSQIRVMSETLGLPEKELYQLVFQKKYKLYKKVYFPNQLKGSEYPLVTPVVFVSWNELRDFSLLIDELDRARREGNLTKKRMAVENAFVNAYGKISGNYSITIDDIRKGNRIVEDFHPVVKGIGNLLDGITSINQRGWWKCSIKKILRMKESQLNKFLDDIITQARPLKKIQRQKLDYKFAYLALLNKEMSDWDQAAVSEDLIYYWIPIDEIFNQPVATCKCQ